MLNKTISAKAIIGEVMRRFGVTDSNITYNAYEWIGYAIGLIGTHVNFVNEITDVEVDFHKIPIPPNFYQLNFIAYNGRKLKHGKKPSFSGREYGTADDPLVIELIQSLKYKCDLTNFIEDNSGFCDTDYIQEFGETGCTQNDFESRTALINNKISSLIQFVNTSPKYCSDEWYSDGGECYNTSIKEGTVYISYKAYPLDSEGFPLVLDEVKYKLALEWYVMRCLIESGYKHPSLDYQTIDFKTNQAIAQAKNEHLKMSYEQVENFTANWTNALFQVRQNNLNYYSN